VAPSVQRRKILSNNFILTWNHGLNEFGRKLVCDQLRTSFEPASVTEFGFNGPEMQGLNVLAKLVKLALHFSYDALEFVWL